MAIDRPIFIVAPPRCGTTLLYRCLSLHPDVGYFRHADRKHADRPRLAHWLTRSRLYRDEPRECRALWTRFHPHRPTDSLTAEDANDEMQNWFHARIESTLQLQKKRRFIAKLPSHCLQLEWLNQLFPDARFVQIIRDWRAVVVSTVRKRRQHFGNYWFGVRPEGWQQWRSAPPALAAAWQLASGLEVIDRSSVKLGLGTRLHSLRYEDLCNHPKDVLGRLLRQLDLPATPPSLATAGSLVSASTSAWANRLSAPMIRRIRREFGDVLQPTEMETEPFAGAASTRESTR